MMRPMAACYRTLSDEPTRGRRRGRLPLPSILLVLLMPALLSISACSKGPGDSALGKTEDKVADSPSKTADAPKVVGGHTFSSDLRLEVFVIKAGGEWEQIGETPSADPLIIPACVSWGVCPIGRVDMKALARQIAAKRILHLQIESWAVDADLAYLEGLTGLRALSLDSPKITDAGLAHLKGLTELRTLYLRGTPITDADLAHLKGLAELRKLDLLQTETTDAGLAHLQDLTGLRELDLSSTKITDAGLAHLKGLTGLRTLDLRGTRITDAGLAHLEGLTALRTLYVWATRGTGAGVADLRKALPRARIRYQLP